MERWQQQSQQRFAILVLVSLALHTPLLMTFNQSTILPVTNSATSISVEIVSKTRTDTLESTPELTKSRNLKTQHTKPQPRPKSSTNVAKQNSQPQQNTIKQAEKAEQHQTSNTKNDHEEQQRKTKVASQPTKDSTANKAQVIHRLKQEVSNYFYYPRLARRQGYEGTVTLRFELHRQGYIADIRVLESSGHHILDLAAKDAVSRMAVGWANSLIHEPSMQIELPIQYILTEG